MIKTYTPNLLILQTYNELSPRQEQQLQAELLQNEELVQLQTELTDTGHRLNTLLRSPSATSLRIIMDHSHKTEHLQEI